MLSALMLAVSAVLLLTACTGAPGPAATSTPVPPLTGEPAAVATPAATRASTLTDSTPPASPTPTGPATDTTLAGQVRYITNTDGIGVKVRSQCDDQVGSTGWPEGTRVTVMYARADCPEWLLVKRSEGSESWVRVAYLSGAASTVVPVAPAPPAASRSPEELLAIIQHGADIRPNDPRVQPFAQQLDRLEAKCVEDRMKLADLVFGANKLMEDRGVREPILETARGVATASEGLTAKGACTDLFTAYALQRVRGAPGTSGR